MLTFIFCGIAFLFNLVCFQFYYQSKKIGIQDIPNERSMHSRITKKSAGIIFTTIALILITCLKYFLEMEIQYFYALISGTVFLSILGLADDIFHLPSTFRFILELVFFFFLGYFCLPEFQIFGLNLSKQNLAGYAILSIYFVFIVNLTNFMDGIDLYLSLTLIATFMNFIFLRKNFLLGNEIFYLITLSGIIAFMIYNYPPAKLFMGDSGSLPLGFLIAMLPFFHSKPNPVELGEIGFLIPVFLTDGTITILKRIFSKKNIFSAHREHLFQKISESFFTKQQTAFIFSLSNLAGGILFFFFSEMPIHFIIICLVNQIAFLVAYFLLEKILNRQSRIPD